MLYKDVDVYFNLHKSVFSVKQRGKQPRVIGHSDFLAVKRPRFVVQEGGRQRVIKEQTKNVHAFVRSEHVQVNGVDVEWFMQWMTKKGFYYVSYNPYKTGAFTNEIGQPIYDADLCLMWLDKDKKPCITVAELKQKRSI